MDENRRNKTRVPFETQVIVRTPEAELTSQAGSRDISLQGLYVETDRDLPEGSRCEVEILLTGASTHLSIRVQGRVARKEAGGLAVAFESIDPDSYYHLRNLLMYNSEDPEIIEQEEHL